MLERAGLSEFDHMKHVRLWNWGRAGRCNPDKPMCALSHVTDLFGKPASTTAGHGETEDGEEATSSVSDGEIIPIDHRDADELDGFIRQVSPTHRDNLRHKYYIRPMKRQVKAEDTDAAVRALLDAIAANKATVRRLRELTG